MNTPKKQFQDELKKALSSYIQDDVDKSKHQFLFIQARLQKRVKENDITSANKIKKVRSIYESLFD